MLVIKRTVIISESGDNFVIIQVYYIILNLKYKYYVGSL